MPFLSASTAFGVGTFPKNFFLEVGLYFLTIASTFLSLSKIACRYNWDFFNDDSASSLVGSNSLDTLSL